MIALKKALVLGLAVTTFSQVPYAVTFEDLIDKPSVTPKFLSRQVASSIVREPQVIKTFGGQVKLFFNDCCNYVKETVETVAPTVRGGLNTVANFFGYENADEAEDITDVIERIANDANFRSVATIATEIGSGILESMNGHDPNAYKKALSSTMKLVKYYKNR